MHSIFVFGLNTPSRGTQAPFSNITLDWTVPNDLVNLLVGKEMDFTYGDCQKEMDMVNKAFIDIMIEGDAHGRGGFQYTHLFHNKRFRLGRKQQTPEMTNRPLFLQLRQFRHGAKRRTVYVLSSTSRPESCVRSLEGSSVLANLLARLGWLLLTFRGLLICLKTKKTFTDDLIT